MTRFAKALAQKVRSLCTIRHPRRWAIFLAYVVLSAIIFYTGAPSEVHAQATASPVEITFVPDFLLRIFAWLNLTITRLFLSITLFAMTFIIEIAAYNGYLDSTTVQVGWVMVRDITNMIFVVALLLIAFGTILGIEQYEWKKLLVKFVLAAIFVNFSRIICGVFIDMAQVVMNTFVNGIAATAGGNLINAFNLADIRSLSASARPEDINDSGLFLASVGAVVFASIVMMTLLYFLILLLLRMIALWILIVLSPLAFVLSVIPQTEGYASEWWSEFGKNVATGPVLLFFVWLAFVTVGNGNVHSHVSDNSTAPENQKIKQGQALEADAIAGVGQSSGISDAMGWNNMANFAIAIGMLMVGARVAGQIGGQGADLMGNAIDFGKKVGYYASGFAAAKYVGEKAVIPAAKYVALDVLPVRHYGHEMANYAKRQWNSFDAWRHATPGQRWQEEYNAATGRYEKVIDPVTGQPVMKQFTPSWIQRQFQRRVIQRAASDKKLEKTEKFAANRREILSKDTKGVPDGWFTRREETIDAYDRFEQGRLKAKEARSAAKTEEFQTAGFNAELNTRRVQFDKGAWQPPRGETLAYELAGHEVRANAEKARGEEIKTKAMRDVSAGAAGREAIDARMRAEISVKANQSETDQLLAASKARADLASPLQLDRIARAVAGAKADETVSERAAAEAEERAQRTGPGLRLAQEKELLETAQAQLHAAEEANQRIFLSSTQGDATLKARVEAEKAGHNEAERVDEQKKMAERNFALSAHGQHEFEEAEARKLRMTAMDSTIKREEEKFASLAVGTAAGQAALRQAKENEFLTGRFEQDVKEAEARAAQEATGSTVAGYGTIRDAIRERMESEIRAGEQEALTKEVEAEEKVQAQTNEVASIQRTKEAEIKAGLQEELGKGIEAGAKLIAQGLQKAAVQATKEAEIKTGSLESRGKQLDEEARARATEAQRDQIAKTVEADRRAKLAGQVADRIKTQEERDFMAGQGRGAGRGGQALAREEAAEALRTQTADETIKRVAADAAADFVRGPAVGAGGVPNEGKALLDELEQARMNREASEKEKSIMEAERKKEVIEAMRAGASATSTGVPIAPTPGQTTSGFARIQAAGVQQKAIDAELEELGKRGAREALETAQGADAITRLKTAEIMAGAEEDEAKAIESKTKRDLLEPMTGPIYDAAKRSGAAKAKIGISDEISKSIEATTDTEYLQSAEGISEMEQAEKAKIRTQSEDTWQKRVFAQAKQRVAENDVDAARMMTEIQKDELLKSSAETSVKAAEAAAKLFAAESGYDRESGRTVRDAMKAAKESEIETSALAGEFKAVEEKVRSEAANDNAALLERVKRAEMVATAATELVKRLESDARRQLVFNNSPEYRALLENQSASKIVQDELSSLEKSAVNKALRIRMEEGQRAELEAIGYERQANEIHTPEARRLLAEAASFQETLDTLRLERKRIENRREAAATQGDEAGTKQAESDLLAFDNQNKAEMERLVKEIRTRRDGATADDKNNLQDPEKQRKKDLLEKAEEARQKTYAWRYARAKAFEDESTMAYSVGHDRLLSDVEQRVIHNKRGVQVPTGALTQPIERYAKSFTKMDYDRYVNNLHDNLRSYIDRRKEAAEIQARINSGTLNADQLAVEQRRLEEVQITDADKAEMAGLLVHGQKNSWLDDAIWKYMGTDLKEDITKTLGWTDSEFNNKKINDVMAIFASGGNMDFVRQHSRISDLMDHAKKNMGMGLTDFFSKMQAGTFTATELQEFQNVASARAEGSFDVRAELAQNQVEEYIKELEANQAQLQLIANMRDEAAGSTHPENGGHGQYVTLGDGRRMYVLVGQQIAMDNVMGEVRKIPVGVRNKMQSHATMRLDEDTGFATAVDERLNSYVRGDINSGNDYRGTNVRYENQSSGLGADAEKSYYYTTDSGFLATGRKANGQYSERHEWLQQYGPTSEVYKDLEAGYGRGQHMEVVSDESGATSEILSLEDAKLQQTSNDIVTNLFAPRIASGPRDFLITMGKMGGVKDVDAVNGVMNVSVMVGGREKKITHINQLIDLYNVGAFTFGSAPGRKLQKFKGEKGGKQKEEEPDNEPVAA